MTVTVLQLSDMHLTASPGGPVSGADPDQRLATVLAAWSALGQRADLIVISGDDADDASEAAYARLASVLEPLDAPVLALPGNHDVPEGVAAAFGGSMIAEVGAWRIVGLDSSVAGRCTGPWTLPAALATLDALDDRPTVVGIHHPPRSRSSHPWFCLDGGGRAAVGRRWALNRTSGPSSAVTCTTCSTSRDPAGWPCSAAPRPWGRSPTTATTSRAASTGSPARGSFALHDDGTLVSTVVVA